MSSEDEEPQADPDGEDVAGEGSAGEDPADEGQAGEDPVQEGQAGENPGGREPGAKPDKAARIGKGPGSRRQLVIVIGLIAVSIVAGTIATAFTPALAARHPLVLIILDARNRNLLLARHVDVVPYVLVGTVRRVLSDPLYLILGAWYGDRAIRWLERQAGGGPVVVVFEKVFARAAYPMVFFFPGAIVCALAGAAGMNFTAFLVVNVAGTVTAVLALRVFGDILGGPVDDVLGFFNRHLVATTAATVALVAVSLVVGRMRGRSELPSVADLEDEAGQAGDHPVERSGAEE